MLLQTTQQQIMTPHGTTDAKSSPPVPLLAAKKKTIYLIRHAESEENRRISALCRTFQSLKKLSLPRTSDVSTSTELLNVSAQVDSNVSEIGANQPLMFLSSLLNLTSL